MKSINLKTLALIFSTNVILAFLSFFGAWAHSDHGEGIIVDILFRLFYVYATPFYWIPFIYNGEAGVVTVIIAIGIDVLIWSIIIERIISEICLKRPAVNS